MCHAVFAAGKAIGLLGLEPHTRRRNRANGVITRAEPGCLHIRVTESFGNCPKYIQVLLISCMQRCGQCSSSPNSLHGCKQACKLWKPEAHSLLTGRSDHSFHSLETSGTIVTPI